MRETHRITKENCIIVVKQLFHSQTTPRMLTRRIEHSMRTVQFDCAVAGLFVGISAGVLISAYRYALHTAEHMVNQAHVLVQTYPSLVVLLVIACAALGLFVNWLIKLEPLTSGSGIPQVNVELQGYIHSSWWKVASLKFIEGISCAFAGLSLGREGPSVQLGAMCGSAISRLTHRHISQSHLLISCGAAAGMSAAFHAPLTGCLFALEEMHRSFNAPLLVAAWIASISADYVSSTLLGVAPVLRFDIVRELSHSYYLLVILFGVVCGLLGCVHNAWMFFLSEKVFKPIDRTYPGLVRIFVFVASAGVIYAVPMLCCGGDAIFSFLANPHAAHPIWLLLALLIGKFFCTSVCFSSQAPGGTLFPLCTFGALIGAIYALVAYEAVGLSDVYVINFIVLGIAGMFASVIRAPICAAVLAFELTGTLDSLLAVSIVAIVSYLCANACRVDGFFEHLTQKYAARIRQQRREEHMPHVRSANLSAASDQPAETTSGSSKVGSSSNSSSESRSIVREVNAHNEHQSNAHTQAPAGAAITPETPQRDIRGHMLVENMTIGLYSALDGCALRDTQLPAYVRVVLIVRHGENVLPQGSTVLQHGDDVLFVWPREHEHSVRVQLTRLVQTTFTSDTNA
ncbi:chloride transporter, ClC family [Fannyhessea vaginae PB189-T1-4]|uniref:Chloride transporter, ClC family n=1 Tax=Fannyhessea vaginae PB189-T1-4 TaxID=866774 RepID=A0ABN0AZ03_9ACTN|nr:chloride transporter, ClC family [Fannyhessea vaginae PB189-T1-4]